MTLPVQIFSGQKMNESQLRIQLRKENEELKLIPLIESSDLDDTQLKV